MQFKITTGVSQAGLECCKVFCKCCVLIVVGFAGRINERVRAGESNELIDVPIGVVAVDRIAGQPDRLLGA